MGFGGWIARWIGPLGGPRLGDAPRLRLRFPKVATQALFRSVAMIVPNLKFICSGLKMLKDSDSVKRTFS